MNSAATDPSVQSLRCSVCGLDAELKCCSRCRSVYYCSRQHQQIDWKWHRSVCSSPDPPLLRNKPNLFERCLRSADNDVNPMALSGIRVSADDNSALLMASIGSNSGQRSLPEDECANRLTNGLEGLNHLVDSNEGKDVLIDRQDLILTKLNSYCESIVRDLNEFGFCVIDDFLTNGSEILSEVLTLYKCGLFRAGQVVNNKAPNSAHLIRGDHIVWVDGTERLCSNIGFLVQTLDSIVIRCNTMRSEGQFAQYRIFRRTKAMIACYPGNDTKYVRHIDNPNHDGRCVTSIYYLNKDYDRQRDGGVLRLFPQMSSCVADIEPKFNRVIFFWSDRRNPHEVMPSTRMRFAITVWYFDANERQSAIDRYNRDSLQYPVDKDLRPF